MYSKGNEIKIKIILNYKRLKNKTLIYSIIPL
jgi:hypothetical protein